MNPGTRSRSGTCSVSYQSWNSSSATSEKFIAAINMPLAIFSSRMICLASSRSKAGIASASATFAQAEADAGNDQGEAEDNVERHGAAEYRCRQQKTADRGQCQ